MYSIWPSFCNYQSVDPGWVTGKGLNPYTSSGTTMWKRYGIVHEM